MWNNASTSVRQVFLSCPRADWVHGLPGGRYTLSKASDIAKKRGARSDKSVLQEVPKNMANEVRVRVTLVCSECKQRNYDTKKNKKNDPDRIELKKYCRFCRKHTVHKESK